MAFDADYPVLLLSYVSLLKTGMSTIAGLVQKVALSAHGHAATGIAFTTPLLGRYVKEKERQSFSGTLRANLSRAVDTNYYVPKAFWPIQSRPTK